jgi:uncharacterized protein YndB with AHSA1/START domain
MAAIEGEILIGRPVDVVFDYVADQRNEPRYNPRMVHAEKISEGPVGRGSVFRSAVASLRRTAEMRIEYTDYERPTLLVSTATMRQANFTVRLMFEPVPGGTRMRWSEEVWPRKGFKLAAPLITWIGRRQERAIWASMKRQLEDVAVRDPSLLSHRPPGLSRWPGRTEVRLRMG